MLYWNNLSISISNLVLYTRSAFGRKILFLLGLIWFNRESMDSRFLHIGPRFHAYIGSLNTLTGLSWENRLTNPLVGSTWGSFIFCLYCPYPPYVCREACATGTKVLWPFLHAHTEQCGHCYLMHLHILGTYVECTFPFF